VTTASGPAVILRRRMGVIVEACGILVVWSSRSDVRALVLPARRAVRRPCQAKRFRTANRRLLQAADRPMIPPAKRPEVAARHDGLRMGLRVSVHCAPLQGNPTPSDLPA
jgi:hypothetical protein